MKTRWLYISAAFLILIFSLVQNLLSQSETGIPRAQSTSMGSLYGYYSHSQGKYLIQPKYSKAGFFSEDDRPIAAVQNNKGEWGYINQNDQVVIPFSNRFKLANVFYNGFASVVSEQDKWGLINRKGELVVEMKYAFTGDCYSGLIPVKNDQNRFGYINPQGEIIIPFLFDRADPFRQVGVYNKDKSGAAFAEVLLNNQKTVVNTRGQYLQFGTEADRGFHIVGDLLVINAFDESRELYMYSLVNGDFTPVFKYSDAELKIYELQDGRVRIVMTEQAVRLKGVHTTSPYDYEIIKIPWKNNINPADLVVPLVSVYDKAGNIIISRDRGYSFVEPADNMISVGRVYVIDGMAAARFGFSDWGGNEVLKTMYYYTCWQDKNNIGVVGFDRIVRTGGYIEYIRSVKNDDAQAESLERHYKKQHLNDKHLYVVDKNMKCISKKAIELKGALRFNFIFDLNQNYVFKCAGVPKMNFVNYEAMNKKEREIIQSGPSYLMSPYTIIVSRKDAKASAGISGTR